MGSKDNTKRMYKNTKTIIVIATLLALFSGRCPADQGNTNAPEQNLTTVKAAATLPDEAVANARQDESGKSAHGQVVEASNPKALRLAKAELQAEFYREALECYRREMDNYKWVINIALMSMGIVVAIGGVAITYINWKQQQESKLSADRSTLSADRSTRERGITELWSEAGQFYSVGDYEKAASIWQEIYEKYKPESRPFFNNWGSTLLNLAKQKSESDPEREKLLKEATEKYKKAEEFTKGIAAYNLASIYALLNDEEECKKWLQICQQTGTLPTRKHAEGDKDLESVRDKEWFKQIRFNRG